jgi:CDP-glycerol glycerophosphotransferase (TagB/SpsB family)
VGRKSMVVAAYLLLTDCLVSDYSTLMIYYMMILSALMSVRLE